MRLSSTEFHRNFLRQTHGLQVFVLAHRRMFTQAPIGVCWTCAIFFDLYVARFFSWWMRVTRAGFVFFEKIAIASCELRTGFWQWFQRAMCRMRSRKTLDGSRMALDLTGVVRSPQWFLQVRGEYVCYDRTKRSRGIVKKMWFPLNTSCIMPVQLKMGYPAVCYSSFVYFVVSSFVLLNIVFLFNGI